MRYGLSAYDFLPALVSFTRVERSRGFYGSFFLGALDALQAPKRRGIDTASAPPHPDNANSMTYARIDAAW